MSFRKGDRVQYETSPHVYTVTRDEQMNGTLRVKNSEGRQIRFNTRRNAISPAPQEEES